MEKFYFNLKTPIEKLNQIKIYIDYSLGGYSYFSGERNKRGYRIVLKPCNKMEGCEESVLMGSQEASGYYIFLEETKRKSEKRMQEWEDKLKSIMPELAELYADKKHKEIEEKIKNSFI